jgi:tripartite-type tricarboxylate transporter receptor subunit TctC
MIRSIQWLLFVAAALAAPAALGQAWPSKPVRILTLFEAGSSGDTTARVFVAGMSESLGQPVVLDNIAGAGGVLAAERVARSAPDGYTLLYSLSSVHIMRPYLTRQLPFHPIDAFTPITEIGSGVTMLVAHPTAPFSTFREMLDYARANPGKVAYGTSGIGSPTHLTGEQIRQITGIDMLHVPYKAVARALQDVMAGQLPTSYAISSLALPAARAGKIKILAIQGDRWSREPGIPTIKEVLPNFEPPPSWSGLFAPAGLPRPLLMRLHADSVKVLRSPEVQEKAAARDYMILTHDSPEIFLAKIRREYAMVGEVVKRAGIKPID